ncbi:hypothetical protein ThvES_00000920 [Thiovulum sp. ES]|nr:hypothetical protein ThvES_00000920 [Thiovulum sp. ES]
MIKILLILLVLTNSIFAVTCMQLKKPEFDKSRALYSVIENTPASLDSNISSDDKNTYFYSDHFRVIIGNSYASSVLEKERIERVLSYAESSWEKEIENIGFQQPYNSEKYFLDIYMGNKSAYNFAESKYVSISSSYAGFATYYSDGTPYFILNPSIEDSVIQATIAHEFFHTIQYSYFDGDAMSDEVWYANIWFLEATAVLMEDEVFPDNNDYIRFVDNYKNYIYKSLEYYNGSAEYGKVLLFKFLKEKYENFDVIFTALQEIDEETKFLEVLENNISNFHTDLLEFGKWILDPENHFEDGDLYDSAIPSTSSLSATTVGHLGFQFIKDSGEYYNSSNPQYLQSSFSGESEKVENLENGIIILNTSGENLDTSVLSKNKKTSLDLKTGWNMIANPYKETISLYDEFNNSLVWIFRNNEYLAFSEIKDYKRVLEAQNIFIDELLSGEGAWVYIENDESINLFGENILKFDELEIDENWKLTNISGSTFNTNFLPKDVTIFYFDNSLNNYRILQNGAKVENFEKVDEISVGSGYFIKKTGE